jgi:hypothetical protein
MSRADQVFLEAAHAAFETIRALPEFNVAVFLNAVADVNDALEERNHGG